MCTMSIDKSLWGLSDFWECLTIDSHNAPYFPQMNAERSRYRPERANIPPLISSHGAFGTAQRHGLSTGGIGGVFHNGPRERPAARTLWGLQPPAE